MKRSLLVPLALAAACSVFSGPSHPTEWAGLTDSGHQVWASTSGDRIVVVQSSDGSQEIFVERSGPFGEIATCEGTGTLTCSGGGKATLTPSSTRLAVAFDGPDLPAGTDLSRVTAVEAVSTHFGTQGRSGSPETKHLEGMFPGVDKVWSPRDMDEAIAAQGVNPLSVSTEVGQCMVKQLELDVLKVLRASQMPNIDAKEFADELVEAAARGCLR